MRLSLSVFAVCFVIVARISVFAAEIKPVKMGNNPKLSKIAIVTTGGTIAQKKDKSGAAVPTVSGVALIQAVPQILKLANVEVYTYCNVDSSRITPEEWLGLSRLIADIVKRPDIAGVIVTHGTDTMAQGSFFIELCVKTEKPVIFVGAMRDASDMSPDGPENIINAVTQAVSPDAKNWGITVSLNQYVNSAFAVRKTNTSNVQTFNSGEKGYLGYIASGKVLRFNERKKVIYLGIPKKLVKTAIFMNYAGCSGKAIRNATDDGVKGIVVEGVGAGNVNSHVYLAIKYALAKGVIVVVTTEVPDGPALPLYGGPGGGASLVKDGVILSRYLRARKARILLMLSLSTGLKKNDIAKLFE
jgi:L-asparaginase